MSLSHEAITVSVEDAARMIGVGISTMWAMVRAGRVEAISLARRRLITVASLHRLVEERKAVSDEPIKTPPVGRGRQPRRPKSEHPSPN
jgi:hypothetical protein